MKPTKFKVNQNQLKIQSKSILYDSFYTLIIIFIMFLIIANPNIYTSGTINGLKLFIFSVLPGLFPFMFLTKLLTEIGILYKITSKLDKFSYKIFGTPGNSIYVFLLSIISGYPIGAKLISDLYEKKLITNVEAKKMSIFCTTSGPLFIICTIGSILFKNIKFGIIIYFSHILSSIILGIIANLIIKTPNIINNNKQTNIFSRKENIFQESLSSTINSLFSIGAFITLFFLITETFETLGIFSFFTNLISKLLPSLNKDYILATLHGIIEVTRGCKELATINSTTSAILACGLVSFSGISIIFQSMSFLKNAKIKMHNFILFKVMHSILSIILSLIFFIL